MKAKDVMTRTVVSIDQDATVLQAARLMPVSYTHLTLPTIYSV